jgi:hypothetical protein
VLALPLVTLVVGYWFNTSLDERQQSESNTPLYAELMGRREERAHDRGVPGGGLVEPVRHFTPR